MTIFDKANATTKRNDRFKLQKSEDQQFMKVNDQNSSGGRAQWLRKINCEQTLTFRPVARRLVDH